MTIENVLENVKKIEVIYDDEGNIDKRELYDDIVCAFEDFENDGVSEIIVSEDESNDNIDYQAYINAENSSKICIEIIDNALDAWIY